MGEWSAEPVMHSLVLRYGELTLKRRSPFVALSRSIVAQQISTKAADTIRRRLAQRFGSTPELYATASIPALRSLGLSRAKAKCLREVAALTLAGEFDELEQLRDESAIARLRTIRGIGPWTAEMFLIFCLGRQDVWPIADAGLRAAAGRLYGANSRSSVEQLGVRFRPKRSVAALYLWKSLENSVDRCGRLTC